MKLWSAILVLVLALCLGGVPARALEPVSQSGAVVAQALGQMGFTEGDDEYTPFGQRYGYPNGYWCDMFVSWCADEAGVSKEAFPGPSTAPGRPGPSPPWGATRTARPGAAPTPPSRGTWCPSRT